MKLIIISSSDHLENEASVVTRLFDAGLETFHLRKHKLSTRKTREFLKAIPAHYHNRIVLHSHHRLAFKFKLKGIHLTRTHKRKKYTSLLRLWLLRLRQPDLVVTTSFSNIGSLFETHPFNFSYVFLSPVFDSLQSKFQSGFTEHSLKSALSKTSIPVVARGGVDLSAIQKAKDLGFHGLAFYSTIWDKKDPVAEFNNAAKRFGELNIKVE
jgi:thiamine-phosphate pyrophosphorylase